MTERNISLTPAEWNLMECLWESAPRTGRETVEYMRAQVGWNRSTTLTMLRRMSEKGLISCDESGEVLRYRPNIQREEAARRETHSFIDRVYKSSVSMMLSAMTEKQELSREEIDKLYAILRQAEEAENE